MLSVCCCCLFVFALWAKLSKLVILYADDWICIFVLFVVYMKHPVQGTTGGWVMPSLIFSWLPLCEFSLFDTPLGLPWWLRD